MDRLKQTLKYIQTQLGVLSVSQRIAIGLSAAMIAGAMLWLLQWSASPDMVPLLRYEFTLDQLDGAEEALRNGGIAFQVEGTRLYVKPADRYNALRILHAGDALPEGSLYDMATLVTEDNPFQSPEAREYAQTYAKGNELAKILATYPGVQKAAVLLNPVTRRRLGGSADVPTASVTVTLAPGREMTSDVVEAFAKLVSGAVAGLKPYNVNIVDARAIRSYNLPRPEDAGNAEHMRMVQKLEDRFLGKIHAKLADIPGLLASVTVELDTSKRVKQTNVHDVPQPKTETQESSEQGAGEAPTEPGFQANVGQAITASSGGKSSTETTSVENFEPKLRETETVEQGPSVRKVTAAVGIPRSFIVGIFRAGRPDAGDPRDDDPDFVALLDAQVERVRASVEKIVMAKSPGDVQVDVYPDVQWGENGPAWASLPRTTAAAGGEWTWPQPWPLFTDHLPQLGLGFLALLSLLLMWRIARRAGEPMLAGAGAVPVGPAAPEPLLASGPFPVGQAAASDGMLVGREVDDETLRYRELTTEVGRLVEDDPEAAAEMIRGWMDND